MSARTTLRSWALALLVGAAAGVSAAPFAIAVDGPIERGDVTTHAKAPFAVERRKPIARMNTPRMEP